MSGGLPGACERIGTNAHGPVFVPALDRLQSRYQPIEPGDSLEGAHDPAVIQPP
jgi:hypothetical protein